MSRYLRYLRIAFSATCLIACVLLIVLWVRSYWYWIPRAIISSRRPKSLSLQVLCAGKTYSYAYVRQIKAVPDPGTMAGIAAVI